MQPRSRVRWGGETFYSTNPNRPDKSYWKTYESCQDIIGDYGGNHPLLIQKYKKEVTGVTRTWNFVPYRNCPWDIALQSILPVPILQIPIFNPQLEILSRSNPSKPRLDMFVSIAELRDLPRTIKTIGSFLMKVRRPRKTKVSWGDGYVGWQFGVAPLISDLQKTLDFAQLVDRKVKELNDLFDGNGIRRRISLDASSDSRMEYNKIFHSSGPYGTVYGDIRYESRQKNWGVAHWSPSRPWHPVPNSPELMALARRTAFSKSISLEGIWNLMPWSWLVDYFVNVGDLFGAYRGGVPASCTRLSLMSHRVTNVNYIQNTGQPGGSYSYVYETKSRTPGLNGSSDSGSLSILSTKQASILAGLALARARI